MVVGESKPPQTNSGERNVAYAVGLPGCTPRQCAGHPARAPPTSCQPVARSWPHVRPLRGIPWRVLDQKGWPARQGRRQWHTALSDHQAHQKAGGTGAALFPPMDLHWLLCLGAKIIWVHSAAWDLHWLLFVGANIVSVRVEAWDLQLTGLWALEFRKNFFGAAMHWQLFVGCGRLSVAR